MLFAKKKQFPRLLLINMANHFAANKEKIENQAAEI